MRSSFKRIGERQDGLDGSNTYYDLEIKKRGGLFQVISNVEEIIDLKAIEVRSGCAARFARYDPMMQVSFTSPVPAAELHRYTSVYEKIKKRMGVIGKTIYSDARVDGYPLEGTIYYIYCDKCGSFKIKTHIRAIQWFMLISLAATIAAFWNYFIDNLNYYGNRQFGCWIIYLAFVIVILRVISPYFPHKCIKCGNTNITYKDVLSYTKLVNVDEIIDAPDAVLHKHNEEDKNVVKDMKVIPQAVLILLYMSLFPVIILIGLPLYYIYSKIKKKN